MHISDAPSIEGPVAGIGHNRPSVADLLRDRFAADIKAVDDLAARANKLRAELGTPPVCSTNEQRDALTALGIEAHKLAKRLDETKLEATRPLRDEVTETNRFFQTITVRPENIKAAFQVIVGEYDARLREEARRRAAEEAEAARLEAQRKLEEAAASGDGVMSDVVMNEAAAAEHRAKHLEKQATAAGAGPTRTEAGSISQRTTWTFRIVDASRLDLNKLRPFLGLADIEKALRGYVKANRDTAPLAGVEIYPETKAQFRG